jgi:hypothetical protein
MSMNQKGGGIGCSICKIFNDEYTCMDEEHQSNWFIKCKPHEYHKQRNEKHEAEQTNKIETLKSILEKSILEEEKCSEQSDFTIKLEERPYFFNTDQEITQENVQQYIFTSKKYIYYVKKIRNDEYNLHILIYTPPKTGNHFQHLPTYKTETYKFLGLNNGKTKYIDFDEIVFCSFVQYILKKKNCGKKKVIM